MQPVVLAPEDAPAGNAPDAVDAAAQPAPAAVEVEDGAQGWWITDAAGQASGSVDYLALARSFDGAAAEARIAELAAAPFAGRRAGTEGGRAAGDAIAAAFAGYGLQPAGDLQPDGSRSYFQQFPLDFFVTYTAPPVLEVFGPDGQAAGPYEFRQDYSSYVRNYAGQGDAEGPVVWANYCRHEDFDVIDAVGAVALCRQGGGEDPTRNAIEHGAAGLLLVGDPDAPIDRIGRYNVPLVPVPLPAFLIDPSVVDDLLAGSGYTFDDLSIQFAGLPLQTNAHLSVALEQQEGVEGRNVLGILPGSDPAFAGEVVVVGGHYDHLGSDPAGELCTRDAIDDPETCATSQGAVYPGANDNASGIATMLEIARTWQEAGFRPRRSVLFAGWDAEEQGLWGSFHFAEAPTVPLEDIAGVLNLDMVGAGADELAVDGPGPVADRLIGLAPTFGITTTLGDIGRSDHVPFRLAGVDASMVIWFGEDQEGNPKLAHYHRPLDTPAVIEPGKLQAVGELAGMTLISLAAAEPELTAMLDQRAQAFNAGDRSAFLATSTAAERAADAAWWDSTASNRPESLSASLVDAVVAGDVATATIRYEITPAGGQRERVDGTVLATRGADGWRLAGPAMQRLTGDGLTLAYPPSLAEIAPQVLDRATAQRAAIARQLGLSQRRPAATLTLHPSHQAMQAAAGLTLPETVTSWAAGNQAHVVASAGITRTRALTDTLTLLALAQTGLSEAQAPWLWRALPDYLAASGDREALAERYLSVLRQMLVDPAPFSATDFPSALRSEAGTPFWNAQAWAMTGYLLEGHGLPGAGDLAAALAQTTDTDGAARAFQQALGQSAAEFDAGWQASWRDRIDGAQAQIDELLARRQAAVETGDRAAFLATGDPTNPLQLADDAAWFDRSQTLASPLTNFELTGQLKGLTADGMLADLMASWQAGDDRQRQVRQTVWLPLRDGQLTYGGPSWMATQSGPVTVLSPAASQALAEALTPLLDHAYRTVAAALGVEPAPLTVKLYTNDLALSLAAGHDLPAGAAAVPVPGGSLHVVVKSQQGAAAVTDVRNELLDPIVAQLLAQIGVQPTTDTLWLRAGLGRIALQWVDPNIGWQQANRLADKIPLAAQQGRFWPLSQLPDPAALASTAKTLAQAEAWDSASYLIQRFGSEGLSNLLAALADGATTDAAMQSALGVSLDDFEQDWLATAGVLHAPPEWLALAESFDAERALAEATRLSGDEFAGRETGTDGGRNAADEIVNAFAELNLEPVGDANTFLQTFAISHTVPSAPPALTLRQGDQTLELAYRTDFLERTGGHALGGQASGPVVWVRDPSYDGMALDGKIVLRDPTELLDTEIRNAAEAGAGALILLTAPGPNRMSSRTPIDGSQIVTPTIPVLELTQDAFEQLLTFSGHTLVELNTAPAALRLDLTAEVAVPLSEIGTRQGANVLGLLPGSDPALADEVVIVSAHLDGPGVDGAGTIYPGANDNAAGVATLLEIARSWRAAGVQPARPVLFAAWDGDEVAQAGSRAYLANPSVPLTATLGMLNLDDVGAGRGFFLTYEGDRNREALTNQSLAFAALALGVRADVRQAEDTGDQTSFQRAGLPATLVIWADADDDANTTKDTADALDVVKLRRSGQVTSLALRWLADH
ncbi:MAG: M20/M25/M40 family metallo-hydrolase [Caldilineales bacterium]